MIHRRGATIPLSTGPPKYDADRSRYMNSVGINCIDVFSYQVQYIQSVKVGKKDALCKSIFKGHSFLNVVYMYYN
jgi:hypothetical protein